MFDFMPLSNERQSLMRASSKAEYLNVQLSDELPRVLLHQIELLSNHWIFFFKSFRFVWSSSK